jgi:hypothetical protein
MPSIQGASDWLNALTDARIANLDDLVLHKTSPTLYTRYFHKEWRQGGVAATAGTGGNLPVSLWQFEGMPGQAAVPSGYTTPDNTTDGSFKQPNAVSGNKYLIGAVGMPSSGMVVIYDRLTQVGGLSGTTTGAQNFNGGSPTATTRGDTVAGLRNLMFLEVQTTLGATATTATVSYVNQASAIVTSGPVTVGSTGRVAQALMIPVPMAQGDTGVVGGVSVTLAASTLAGTFNFVIARPLAMIMCAGGSVPAVSSFTTGMIAKIDANACLAAMIIPTSTQSTALDLLLEFVEA